MIGPVQTHWITCQAPHLQMILSPPHHPLPLLRLLSSTRTDSTTKTPTNYPTDLHPSTTPQMNLWSPPRAWRPIWAQMLQQIATLLLPWAPLGKKVPLPDMSFVAAQEIVTAVGSPGCHPTYLLLLQQAYLTTYCQEAEIHSSKNTGQQILTFCIPTHMGRDTGQGVWPPGGSWSHVILLCTWFWQLQHFTPRPQLIKKLSLSAGG